MNELNRKLLDAARNKLKKKLITTAWTSNGGVHVKTADGTSHTISSITQLNHIVHCYNLTIAMSRTRNLSLYCNICNVFVRTNQKAIKCCVFKYWFYTTCIQCNNPRQRHLGFD